MVSYLWGRGSRRAGPQPRRPQGSLTADITSTGPDWLFTDLLQLSRSSKILRRVLSLRPKSTSVIGPASNFNHHGSLGLHTLFAPSDPLIEYVFIHGLGGGSTRTWCLEPDPSYFWPKEWLPRHAGFRNVRIHSFGYDSDWKSKCQSIATVHDFGQALLLALRTSECFSESTVSR